MARGGWLRTLVLALVATLGAVVPVRGVEAQTVVPATATYEGPMDFVATGASIRTSTNGGDPCAVRSRRDDTPVTVSGIPGGATVRAAYLYWAGSGATTDYSVTLNGTTVNAGATQRWQTTYDNNGTILTFFGGGANVTGMVTGNGTYNLSALTVASGNPYCGVSAVTGGFGLYVVYELASLPLRRIELREAFSVMRGASASLVMNGFLAGAAPNAKISLLAFEGDPDIDGDATGREEVTINGSVVSTPANNSFDGAYGFDLDSWSGPSLVPAGARTVTMGVSTGGDLLLLQSMISGINIQLVDVTPKAGGPVARLGGGRYAQTFNVENVAITPQAYDLLARATGSPAFVTIDSIRGPGLNFLPTRGDSARTSTLAAGSTTTYTVWYRTTVGAPLDNLEFLRARSVTYPTRSEAQSEGSYTIRRAGPQLAIAKTVTPNTNIGPGTDLTYRIGLSNTGTHDAVAIVTADDVPTQTVFKLGSVAQTLPAGVTAAVAYSNAATGPFGYTPVSAGCAAPAGYDGCVRRVQWTFTGAIPAGNSATALTFVARVK